MNSRVFEHYEWSDADFLTFSDTLKSFSKGQEKAMWEKRIVNTRLPCLAVPSTEVDYIAKSIYKGNYRFFLDKMPHENHSEMLVCGKVINCIKNIKDYIKYLDMYVVLCDNWSATDILKFPKNKNCTELLKQKSVEYLRSSKPFVRRVGLLILMKNFVDETNIEDILNTLEKMQDENEYYVLMEMAWLICEIVIKLPKYGIGFIKNSSLCDFVINKAISKCVDSYRIDKDTKLLLKSLRRKNIKNIKIKKDVYD